MSTAITITCPQKYGHLNPNPLADSDFYCVPEVYLPLRLSLTRPSQNMGFSSLHPCHRPRPGTRPVILGATVGATVGQEISH